jgi:hypothetical protein
MSRPRFKMRRTEDPGQDPHWQDVKSPTSWKHLRPVPTRGIPRQVSASHGKSPSRTTSLHLTREVSASHELSPAPTGAWATTRGASLGHEHHHCNAWGSDSRTMQMHQLAVMQAAGPNKSLNAGLSSCTTIPSTSSAPLPHASSA